jgi:hypothetical protein
MLRRFEPSQQCADYQLVRRIDPLDRHFSPYFREFLVPCHVKHTDRFRPKSGGSSSHELRDAEVGDWEED